MEQIDQWSSAHIGHQNSRVAFEKYRCLGFVQLVGFQHSESPSGESWVSGVESYRTHRSRAVPSSIVLWFHTILPDRPFSRVMQTFKNRAFTSQGERTNSGLYTNGRNYFLITHIIPLAMSSSKNWTNKITGALKSSLTSLQPNIKGFLLTILDPVPALLPNLLGFSPQIPTFPTTTTKNYKSHLTVGDFPLALPGLPWG